MSFLMAGDLVGLGIAFFYLDNNTVAQVFCVIFILLFVVLFEFSLGPIPWLYMAEIMTEKGLSIAILLNWLMTILMAVVTPFVISGELFIVFGGLCGVVRIVSISISIYRLHSSVYSFSRKPRVLLRLKLLNFIQERRDQRENMLVSKMNTKHELAHLSHRANLFY